MPTIVQGLPLQYTQSILIPRRSPMRSAFRLCLLLAFPVWSQSQNKSPLAFTTDRDGNEEIYLMDADGANPRPLTDHPGSDLIAAWSPDGHGVVFTSDRDGDSNLFFLDLDGGTPQIGRAHV